MSRQDRLAADLERAAEALDAGDIEKASTIVERCRRIDRRHPDVVMLGAAIADATGDVDAALEQYELLCEILPDEGIPRIALARLQLHDLGEPQTALATLATAFELIDDEDALLEAIVLKTEAHLAEDDLESARDALAELSSDVIDDPEVALELADLALDADAAPIAMRWVGVALAAAADDAELRADALFVRGRIYEATDEREAMIADWQEVLRLDKAATSDVEHAISEDELEEIATATLAELPENVRTHLERVPILIADFPDEHVVADGFDPRLLGLFTGSPLPEDGALAPSVTNILLFRKNLERVTHSREDLAEQIRITVLHETAHYFGLDDEDLEKLGLD